MPFSAGVFSKLFSWATEQASSPIEIAKLDTQEADFVTGFNNCMLRDGTGLPSADQDFNGKKITNLATASAGSHALSRDAADARYTRYIPKRKFINTSRSLTTTFADDPDLIAALEASSFYGFEFFLHCFPNSGGIKFRVEYSGTYSSVPSIYNGHGYLASANAIFASKLISDTGDSINVASGSSSEWLRIWGTVATTTAGNLSLAWGQNSSNASSSTLFQGSYLSVDKLG